MDRAKRGPLGCDFSRWLFPWRELAGIAYRCDAVISHDSACKVHGSQTPFGGAETLALQLTHWLWGTNAPPKKWHAACKVIWAVQPLIQSLDDETYARNL